ncbi:hypothetical protein ACFSRY_14535 [Pontibacter locisalis]|uniref:Uncharacterized protein n=1 Tax=Pontibacter locisalis TaxID=1719035 RepID=A0ABW5IQQ7_9BACT
MAPFFFKNVSNWLVYLIAVAIVNVKRMMAGSFVYTFRFYSLLFMGVCFLLLSLYPIRCIWQISRGEGLYYPKLKAVSWLVIALSLPIFPLNPIGLLTVISSVIILITAAATKKQWQRALAKPVMPVQEAVGA